MSAEPQNPESAVVAVRRWEELAADRTHSASRIADRRAQAQAKAAGQRAERAAAQRRQEVLDAAYADAETTSTAAATAVADLQSEAANRQVELLRAAVKVILPATSAGPGRFTAATSTSTSTSLDTAAGRDGACSSG